MFLAKIRILLKPSILDPEGQTVRQALHKLGHTEIEKLRMGRYIELYLKAKEHDAAAKKVKRYCEVLLANPVIESYDFDLEAVPE